MAALDGVDALMVPTAPMHPRIDDVAADPVGVNSRMGTYTNFCNLFDMCAVSVPAGTAGDAQFGVTVLARAFDDAVALDIAAMALGAEAPQEVWPLAVADVTELVVFGAHLRGGPLVHQLTDLGRPLGGRVDHVGALPHGVAAVDATEAGDHPQCPTAAGTALKAHRWLLSPAALGRFLAGAARPDATRQGRIRRRHLADRRSGATAAPPTPAPTSATTAAGRPPWRRAPSADATRTDPPNARLLPPLLGAMRIDNGVVLGYSATRSRGAPSSASIAL